MSESKDPGQAFLKYSRFIREYSCPGPRGTDLASYKVNKGTDYGLGWEPDSGVATYVVVGQCLLHL